MKRIALLVLVILALFSSCAPKGRDIPPQIFPTLAANSAETVPSVSDLTPEVRGAWIASVYNINFPSRPDLSAEELKGEMDKIVNSAAELGLNTLFFQVHPCSDSLYKSELFPVSKYLFTDGVLHFDPLEYMISACHAKDIKLHAWVNPLRVSTNKSDSREQALALLEKTECFKDEYIVYFGDGKLYYNAGDPEVQGLIADCVGELAANYKVDGIVFDDYFYPYPSGDSEFDDSAEYEKYGQGMSLENWRRENINTIIRNCFERIKSENEKCLFGVSPFGVWQNDNGANGGSPTSGLEGYTSLYCDSLAWARGGYVDYISPQLYWNIESTSCPFEELCSWWNTRLDEANCDFIPSLAPYRYDGDWEDPSGEIKNQLELGRDMLRYRGAVMYGFASLCANSNGVSDEVKSSFENDRFYYTPAPNPVGVSVTYPADGTVTEESTLRIDGISDPQKPLTVNGKSVCRRVGGAFSETVTLAEGENKIALSCGDKELSITVYRDKK